VDVGTEEEDTAATIKWLKEMTTGGKRKINAFFITHGHPDHCMALWRMQEAFPNVPAFVATTEIKNELVNVMNIFGKFLNQSSPGNPKAQKARSHYNYDKLLRTLYPPGFSSPDANEENSRLASFLYLQQIWNGTDVHLFSHFTTTGETNHYSYIYLPGIFSLISGDLVYVRSHLFMGFDVSLMSQCDWIYHLKMLQANLPPNTLIYPGHGAVGLPSGTTTQQIIEENIEYIEFSRMIFVNTCNTQLAIKQVIQRYPTWEDQSLLMVLSAPFRVPGDASALGCDCKTMHDVCNIVPPTCSF